MYSKIISAVLTGIDATKITIEADMSNGLPVFDLVGFLSSEVKEARERVRTALKNLDIALPAKRITINLSPANIKKQGTSYDFGIALALLVCIGLLPQNKLNDCCVIGELSLDGSLIPVHGVLSKVLMAKNAGLKNVLVPFDNAKEAALVKDINIFGYKDLREAISHLRGELEIKPTFSDTTNINTIDLDFADISGQTAVKRALEISASGLHNILIVGPPGSGKTMSAKRLPYILPPLTYDESLEITKIHSVAGKLPDNNIITKRPFVSPHHTCTPQALSGGGVIPRPGAITLAHRAVLFLDELPEFKNESLEILRQPMEDKVIHISRANSGYCFPADFLLVAAMNPCKCGYYPDMNKCRCTPNDVKKYLNKISGPLLDRIDLCVQASTIDYDALSSTQKAESSLQIQKRVLSARDRQLSRFKNEDYKVNSHIKACDIDKYCPLEKSEKLLIKDAFKTFSLSARSYHKILKVSRTIADMDSSDNIKEPHICEALSFRNIDINNY